MTKRQHISELVYMRAIAAFGIFTIHATGSFAVLSDFDSKAQYLGTFLNQIFRFATPIFIAISGFVLFYNNRSLQEFNFKTFINKKLRYLVLPYLVWSIGYYLFTSYMYSVEITMASTQEFLLKLLVGDSYAHLYFVFLILQFYLLFPIILKLLGEQMKEKPIKVLLICLFLQASILIYQYYFKIFTDNWFINIFNNYYWKAAFGWFFYFILGGVAAFHYKKLSEILIKYFKLILFGYIISTILFLGEAYLYLYVYYNRDYYQNLGSLRPLNLIYSVFTFLLLLLLAKKIDTSNNRFSKILASFGTYSLGIYFSHPMILEYLKIRLFNYYPTIFGYSRISSIIFIMVLGWLLTIGVCYFISMFRFRWVFLGKVSSVLPALIPGIGLSGNLKTSKKLENRL